MSWLRVVFALILPIYGGGSYNNYRLSCQLLMSTMMTMMMMMMMIWGKVSCFLNYTMHYKTWYAMHATTIWAILSWKMCLVALAGSSPDQFVSDHNLIFSADFAGMRDIWTNFKRFDIQTEAQFIKVKRFDLGCNFEKTLLLEELKSWRRSVSPTLHCWGGTRVVVGHRSSTFSVIIFIGAV